jgi:Flp pilus assembly pilin Flp
MSKMMRRFLEEESGPTIVEYAVMLVLVAIAVAAASPGFRAAVVGVFSDMVALLAQR